jgi:hypothetical protein
MKVALRAIIIYIYALIKYAAQVRMAVKCDDFRV